MLAGTISMAMGEYVSVNTQKIHKKWRLLSRRQHLPMIMKRSVAVVQKYVNQGISKPLAQQATGK